MAPPASFWRPKQGTLMSYATQKPFMAAVSIMCIVCSEKYVLHGHPSGSNGSLGRVLVPGPCVPGLEIRSTWPW